MKLKKKITAETKVETKKENKLFKKQQKFKEEKPKYANLDEIMDKNRAFNIFYSGVEDANNFNILYDMGIRNFLMSYHYIQNRHLSMHQMYSDKGVKFFIDSGAHTYQNDPKYLDYDIEYWEEHLKKYLNWVEKNRDYVFAIASFDFENVVGASIVKKWNEQYFEPFMLRTGIPVCFVWHQDSAMPWDYYCKRYPYVGFSSVNTEGVAIDIREYQDKLRIAENNDALVHGFGMTRTAMLTQLPFYTADSTTWLVGLQYGEINFWNGQKMQRLKKDVWKGNMLPTLIQMGFDEEKLLSEDTEELIRVNIEAFIEAEEYVQTRLKSRMYWLKPKTVKRSEADLLDIEYPTPAWLFTPRENRQGTEEYARQFNISYENPEEAMNLVVDMTCFMNWDNPDYQEFIKQCYTPEILAEIHNVYINRIVGTDEERIEDLKEFYKNNLLGIDNKLLLLGTNFDRIVKEREDSEYITDEEYDYEDVDDLEINNISAKYLPAPKEGEEAPEISELDDEIFEEQGIIPVRDENGHFLKGQRKVLKPKKLYSEKYPKLACDMCVNAQRCPQYKAGYVCAYNKMFNRYNTRDMGDVIQAMQGIVDLSMQRLQRSMLTEVMNGGMPDPNVSQMMNQSMQMLNNLQRMYESANQEVIRQTRVLRADGTQEMTTQVSNPQSGGILAQIFGNMNNSSDEADNFDKDNVIEAEPFETKE